MYSNWKCRRWGWERKREREGGWELVASVHFALCLTAVWQCSTSLSLSLRLPPSLSSFPLSFPSLYDSFLSLSSFFALLIAAIEQDNDKTTPKSRVSVCLAVSLSLSLCLCVCAHWCVPAATSSRCYCCVALVCCMQPMIKTSSAKLNSKAFSLNC